MTNFIPHLSISVLAIGSSVYCTNAFVAAPLRLLRAVPTVPPRAIYNNMSRRRIEEILLELDARGISFPPTATRSELERLLSQADVLTPNDRTQSHPHEDLEDYSYDFYDYKNDVRPSRKQQQQIAEPMNTNRRRRQRQRQTARIEFYEGDDNSVNRRESRRRRRQQQQISQLAPADVLFRVVDKTSKTVAQAIPEQVLDMGSKATRLASRTTKHLLQELVDGGPPKKRNGVRRRKQLDDTAEHGHPKVDQFSVPDSKDRQREDPKLEDNSARNSPAVFYKTVPNGAESSTRDAGRVRVPIQDILLGLTRRNIRFSPKSTRADLEELLAQAKSSEEEAVTPASDSAAPMETSTHDQGHPSSTTGISSFANVVDERQDNLWKRASRVTAKKVKIVPKKISETIGTRARNTYQKARNTAAGLFEDSSDLIDIDNTPIIVDAIVEDITKQQLYDEDDDDVIDVEPFYRRERHKPRRRNRSPSNPNDDPKDLQGKTKPLRHPRMYQEVQTSRKGTTSSDKPMDDQPTANARLPRLSPATKMPSQELESQRDRGRHSNSDRTIYSPYRNGNDIYVDGLDRLGDFVANSVDSFLWGSEKEGVTPPAPESPRQSSKRRRRGNWKDKMEEQFDYMLGIHEDGEYYNRWVNDELDTTQRTDGTEGVPRSGRNKSRSRKERQPYSKPIWEEEGSLLSKLFGTNEQAGLNDMFDRSRSTNGSGSVVKIIKTLLQSATLVASGVCRWASVRGSLPQPLVVVGVLSSVLTSRPRSRVRNLIFAVLALRTLGELLHGYSNDDTEFLDPIDDQDSTMR